MSDLLPNFLAGGWQTGTGAGTALRDPVLGNELVRVDASGMDLSAAFSFARAIQQPALEIWHGEESNVAAAQQALYHRARCNRDARRGQYDAATERT